MARKRRARLPKAPRSRLRHRPSPIERRATFDPYFKLRPFGPPPPNEVCRCRDRPPVLLCQRLGMPNPLVCGRCNGEVPPGRIGFGKAPSLVEAVADWAGFHRAFETLWLDSGEFETWAERQLLDPKSPVNVRGLDVVRRLSKYRTCYLDWHSDPGAEGYRPPTVCPRCRRRLRRKFVRRRPQRGSLEVCDACHIAYMV